MRRIENLQNTLYQRKYKEIYQVIFTADLDEVSDHSNWFREGVGNANINQPLWIICESKLIGKRIWITESFGQKEITIADLSLDCRSKEYSESHQQRTFNNESEMIKYLKELLKPCLEKSIPKELREGIYEIAPLKKDEYLHFNSNLGTVTLGHNVQDQIPIFPTSNIITIEEFDRCIEKNDEYRSKFINDVQGLKVNELFYGEEAYKDFKNRFPYLYEKGLKNLNDRKYIIKYCTDCFGAKDFFGYKLDTKTNRYEQYTDGMDVLDLIEEHPQFQDYYKKHSKELMEEYDKESEQELEKA